MNKKGGFICGYELNGKPIENAVAIDVDYIDGRTRITYDDGCEIRAPNNLVSKIKGDCND